MPRRISRAADQILSAEEGEDVIPVSIFTKLFTASINAVAIQSQGLKRTPTELWVTEPKRRRDQAQPDDQNETLIADYQLFTEGSQSEEGGCI